MPIRTYEDQFRIPHTLQLYSNNGVIYEDFEELKRCLPYVDVETGLRNRIILRDPITGLGNLSPEINTLRESKILRRRGIQRNPILHEGPCEEYNCLYTTKILSCRIRTDRDPITLRGQLGEELDLLRPNGGRPRNKRALMPQRDPIAGIGEFGREWDPIYKYSGRPHFNRAVYKKTDPITHTVKADFRIPFQLRHFPPIGCFDIIGHTDDDKYLHAGTYRGRKVFPKKYSITDITVHKSFNPEEIARADFKSVRPFHDPITHLDYEYTVVNNITTEKRQKLPNRNGIQPKLDPMSVIREVTRNPITGEGMNAKDYYFANELPHNFCFRNCIRPTKANSDKEKVIVVKVHRPTQVTKAVGDN